MTYTALLHRMILMLYTLILVTGFLFILLQIKSDAKTFIISALILGALFSITGIVVYEISCLSGKTNAPLFAIVCLSFIQLLYIAYKFFKKNKVNKQILTFFFLYVLAVLYITLFARMDGGNNNIIVDFFSRGDWNWTVFAVVKHFMLNLLMFVPLGLLAKLVSDKTTVKNVFFLGLLFSTYIESLQLIFHMGESDINDVLSNALGALIGALIGIVFEKRIQKKQ